jgi:hypothetical protein
LSSFKESFLLQIVLYFINHLQEKLLSCVENIDEVMKLSIREKLSELHEDNCVLKLTPLEVEMEQIIN